LNFLKYISETNGIPDYVATLYTSDFVKQNAVNHKLTQLIIKLIMHVLYFILDKCFV